jgi:hypothetical protein
MRALVVYESMFGNTRTVALAIADGISAKMSVETLEIAVAPRILPPDIGLLVVGGPTHAHGMTSRASRANAARRTDGGLVSSGSGLREYLGSIRAEPGVVAAAFDTRVKGPMLFTGSAATSATRQLQKVRFKHVEPPRSFVLDGATGPLVDRVPKDELDAARSWGASLAATVITIA